MTFFSEDVMLIAFESLVDQFGGRTRFNEMVSRKLGFDYYREWVIGKDDGSD